MASCKQGTADDNEIDWASLNVAYKEYEKNRWKNVKELQKCVYTEHEEIKKLSEKEVNEFKSANMIKVMTPPTKHGDGAQPKPIRKFKHAFHNHPWLRTDIMLTGFSSPSPLQCQLWPILLSGHDVLAIAPPGSGKTFGYLMPAFVHVWQVRGQERKGPIVLILTDNDDVSIQIQQEIVKFGRKACCIVDGYFIADEVNECDIIVSTVDAIRLLYNHQVNLSNVNFVVFDDLDVDYKCEVSLKLMMREIRPDKQLAIFAVGMTNEISRVSNFHMVNHPLIILIGGSMLLAMAKNVVQKFEIVELANKTSRLHKFLDGLKPDEKAICFFDKINIMCDILVDRAIDKGQAIVEYHGEMNMQERQRHLHFFRTAEVKVMFATNLVSRGIDVGDDVNYIVNYDFPANMLDYVKRQGKTGRLGKSGTVLSLMSKKDKKQVEPLMNLFERSDRFVPYALRNFAKR
jgi:ATP-dependent RNA helicase DDX43